MRIYGRTTDNNTTIRKIHCSRHTSTFQAYFKLKHIVREMFEALRGARMILCVYRRPGRPSDEGRIADAG